jgi:hypothetical protein
VVSTSGVFGRPYPAIATGLRRLAHQPDYSMTQDITFFHPRGLSLKRT